MKKNILGFLVIVLLSGACKELPPYVNMEGDPNITFDTTYITLAETPQDKNVFLEDFTGVRCGNCPKGHVVVENLRTTWGKRVVAAASHGYAFTNFTAPYTGEEDFRTEFGGRVFEIIGTPQGLPFAAIDRSVMGSVTSQWKTASEAILNANNTPVNIKVSITSLTESQGKKVLGGDFQIALTQDISEDIYVSVLIVESDIISPQLDDAQGKVVEDYHHNHIVRDYPVFRKKLVSDGNFRGRLWKGKFGFDVTKAKVSENSAIIFLVHKGKEVLQALETDFK